jgi:hypothetical protein
MDAAVLHFIKFPKGMPITWQVMKEKAKETMNSFGITNFKTGQGWCNKFMCHKGVPQALNINLSKDSS